MSDENINEPEAQGWQTYEVATGVAVCLLLIWGLGSSLSSVRHEAINAGKGKERQEKLQKLREAVAEESSTHGVVDAKNGLYRIPLADAMTKAADAMREDPVAFRKDLLDRLPAEEEAGGDDTE